MEDWIRKRNKRWSLRRIIPSKRNNNRMNKMMRRRIWMRKAKEAGLTAKNKTKTKTKNFNEIVIRK